jgi:hypothetical protein
MFRILLQPVATHRHDASLYKIVSRFYLYIHELLWEYLLMNGYCMAHIREDKYMSDPKA